MLTLRDDGMFYAYAAGRRNILCLRRGCFRRATACVPRRWKVLSGEFRRRPTEFVIKLRNPDRVGRRGLFEPREDFSRLHTYAIPWLDSVAVSVAHPLAYPAVGKFSRASSAGGRRHLQ